MKRLLPCLLLLLALNACDRRDMAPREASESTDTVIVDPAATVPSQVDPFPPPATSACAGLDGTEEADCRAREQRTGDEAPDNPDEAPTDR